MDREPVHVDANASIKACPKTQVGASWPLPVDQRLQDLVAAANRAGLNTSKQELLAAIVCGLDASDDAVEQSLRSYRTATAGQVSLREPSNGNVIQIDRHGPGRRTG